MNTAEDHHGEPEAGPAPAPQDGLISGAYSDLDVFLDRLETIEAAIEDLQEAGDEATAPAIRKLRRQIKEFEPSITMIGQVKAGKTSLVNAMVGSPDLLPADINPWTSVVTSLHMQPTARKGAEKSRFRFFSEEEWDHLVSRGGRVGELAARAGAENELEKVRQQLEEMREASRQRLGNKFEMLLGQEHEYGYVDEELIQRYVCLGDNFAAETETDQTQGRFADITRSADLYLGQPELPMRLCIRDTPGVNDTFMIREQITVNAIRESRLCVVVLSAHQALSTVDMALIRMISNIKSREVIIFVNRVDELGDPAREIPEIRKSIAETLKANDGPADAEIIFGSAFWASHALKGEYQSLGRGSAEALLNLAEYHFGEGGEMPSVEDMVWWLSGLPDLAKAIAGRILTGEGAEFEDRIVREAQNIAGGISASRQVLSRAMSGGKVPSVSRSEISQELVAIRNRATDAMNAKFEELLAGLDNRLAGSRRTFVGRATSALVQHLDTYGEDEVWTYDPTGLRVLLRSGYQSYATRAAKAAAEIYQQATYEIRTLYLGAFQPPDGMYELEPPRPPDAPAPVTLGQTIALDIKGSWWSKWWRRRRSYEAYADEFSGMIDAEIGPVVGALRTDHAEPHREAVAMTLYDFIEGQRQTMEELAGQTDEDLEALRVKFAEDAGRRAERLQSALNVLAEFRTPEGQEAAE